MRYSRLKEIIGRTSTKVEETGTFRDSDLPDRLRVANKVCVVSGEFHPMVYNNSPIIPILEERWKSDAHSSKDEHQIVHISGGPSVYFADTNSYFGLTGYKNDFFHLLELQFGWTPNGTRQIHQSVIREEVHYWLLDDKFLYFQEPHNDDSHPNDRVSYFCDASDIANNLIADFDAKMRAGTYRKIFTKSVLQYIFSMWDIDEQDNIISKSRRKGSDSGPSKKLPSREVIEKEVAIAREYFHEEKDSLMKQEAFVNKYVAVVGKKIIDSGSSDLILFERMSQLHPGVPFFIGWVGSDEKVIHMGF